MNTANVKCGHAVLVECGAKLSGRDLHDLTTTASLGTHIKHTQGLRRGLCVKGQVRSSVVALPLATQSLQLAERWRIERLRPVDDRSSSARPGWV